MTVQYIGSLDNKEVMRVGLGETRIVLSDSEEVRAFLAAGNEITPIEIGPEDAGTPFERTFIPEGENI
jgi:hypothetical protein